VITIPDLFVTHIPHPKLSQREITEIKNPSEHKNKHIEKKRGLRNSKLPKMASKPILNKEQ